MIDNAASPRYEWKMSTQISILTFVLDAHTWWVSWMLSKATNLVLGMFEEEISGFVTLHKLYLSKHLYAD